MRAPRKQVRKRGADCQRADDDTERGSAPVFEPSGSDLHSWRVDAGERQAGDARSTMIVEGRWCDRNDGIGGRTGEASGGEQPPCVDTSARFNTLLTRVPATNPACTAIVSHAVVERVS